MRDTTTTLQQLKTRVKKFQQERNWNPQIKNLAISIAIEAAELLELFQWDDYAEYQKRQDAKKEDVWKELADVIIYCLQFAAKADIDITHAVEKKLALNAKKYPAHLFGGKQAGDHYYKIKSAYRAKK